MYKACRPARIPCADPALDQAPGGTSWDMRKSLIGNTIHSCRQFPVLSLAWNSSSMQSTGLPMSSCLQRARGTVRSQTGTCLNEDFQAECFHFFGTRARCLMEDRKISQVHVETVCAAPCGRKWKHQDPVQFAQASSHAFVVGNSRS